MKAAESFIAIGHRYFVAVAEQGSVRAAARALNVAASAISRQLILLEAQLGIALFDRSGRTLELSPAGEVLLRGLRAAAQGHEETLDHLNALRGLKRGRVRVATVESISVSVLPDIFVAFANAYPGIELTITVAGSDAVTELVHDHHADIGFTFNPASLEGLDVVTIRDMQLGAIMAPGHALAGAKSLTLAQCLQHRVAWPSRGLSLRAILDRATTGALRFAFECNSLRLMASLARRGSCIAFQTPIGIEQEIAAGGLIWVPLTDRKLAADRLMIVRRPGQKGRPAADALIDLVLKHLPAGKSVRK
jgi:DNA-binding transcriptional LysR family regulator